MPELTDRPILNGFTATLSDFDECEPGYILGSCYLFDVMHHVELIRVMRLEDGTLSAWIPPNATTKDVWQSVNWNNTRLENLHKLDTDVSIFNTVIIPELPGEWVAYMLPGCS